MYDNNNPLTLTEINKVDTSTNKNCSRKYNSNGSYTSCEDTAPYYGNQKKIDKKNLTHSECYNSYKPYNVTETRQRYSKIASEIKIQEI